MRRNLFLCIVGALLVFSIVARAQEAQMVEESSTHVKFPATVTFTHDSVKHTLQLTGLTVRKKFVFKVYAIAHYMENPTRGDKEHIFQEALSDGKAKQITMHFVRGVGVGKITDAYREAFEKSTTEEERKALQPFLERFIGYHNRDVKKGDEYILRWLPGGTVISILQGEEKPAITDPTFARVLWSIWLGEKSIVKREKLISRLLSAE